MLPYSVLLWVNLGFWIIFINFNPLSLLYKHRGHLWVGWWKDHPRFSSDSVSSTVAPSRCLICICAMNKHRETQYQRWEVTRQSQPGEGHDNDSWQCQPDFFQDNSLQPPREQGAIKWKLREKGFRAAVRKHPSPTSAETGMTSLQLCLGWHTWVCPAGLLEITRALT